MVFAALLTGQAGAAPRSAPSEFERWRPAAIAALRERADADSLATAAALAYVGDSKLRLEPARGDAALELAAHASALAPDDAAIGWIQVRLCANTPGCDIRDTATAMRWLDPDNAAAWLPTLAAAEKDKDTVEIDRVIADMAQGARFDFYWNRIVVLMFGALKAVSKSLPKDAIDSDASRLSSVIGIAAGEFVPPFLPLTEACRESAAGTERREFCQKIAKNLQQGDTIVAQITGLGVERHFLPADSKESHALGERRRVLEWRLASAGKFDTPVLPWLKNAHARWRVARMRALRREEDVLLAILREQGTPIDPPETHP
jgi:hypothetical protein